MIGLAVILTAVSGWNAIRYTGATVLTDGKTRLVAWQQMDRVLLTDGTKLLKGRVSGGGAWDRKAKTLTFDLDSMLEKWLKTDIFWGSHATANQARYMHRSAGGLDPVYMDAFRIAGRDYVVIGLLAKGPSSTPITNTFIFRLDRGTKPLLTKTFLIAKDLPFNYIRQSRRVVIQAGRRSLIATNEGLHKLLPGGKVGELAFKAKVPITMQRVWQDRYLIGVADQFSGRTLTLINLVDFSSKALHFGSYENGEHVEYISQGGPWYQVQRDDGKGRTLESRLENGLTGSKVQLPTHLGPIVADHKGLVFFQDPRDKFWVCRYGQWQRPIVVPLRVVKGEMP